MNRNFGLDLLRAISIWLVLLQHLGLSVPGFTQLKIGGVGVEIFFVLSKCELKMLFEKFEILLFIVLSLVLLLYIKCNPFGIVSNSSITFLDSALNESLFNVHLYGTLNNCCSIELLLAKVSSFPIAIKFLFNFTSCK